MPYHFLEVLLYMKLALYSFTVALFTVTTAYSAQAGHAPLLLRNPSIQGKEVVFSYSDNLWSVSAEGGNARLLTTGEGNKTNPYLSPDGKWIAFTERLDGNTDVYIMPAQGGMRKRLTFHPGPDIAVGWTPDSKAVLFQSPRNSYSRFSRLFTVSIDGGLPIELPVPEGVMGSFSPNGKYLAYVPVWDWAGGTTSKHYRGGRTARIWIAKLSDSSIERIPRDNSNDFDPMWVGDKVYFLSDRKGPVTIFSYDLRSKHITQVLPAQEQDIKWASAVPGTIVYARLGSLHKLDLASGKTSEIRVEVAGDLPALQPHFITVAREISNYDISPSGVRVAFEAHGDVLTVPVQKGDIRNLTNTAGAAERDPAWSPDGKWIAYFSDETGEYQLHLRSQSGTEVRKIDLGRPPSFFYSPRWSPDSSKIAYFDKRLNLWYVDINKGAPVKVATDYYDTPAHTLDPAWSPDSRWLAYTLQMPTHLHSVFLYSLESGRSQPVTDGMSDARYPSFDRNGKYLYFTASTNAGPTSGWLDLSGFARLVTRSVYAVILRNDLPSPVSPESDEEKIKSESPASETPARAAAAMAATPPKGPQKPDEEAHTAKSRIDFENIGQRIIALPIPARNYVGLHTAPGGMIYLLEAAPPMGLNAISPHSVYRFDFESRRTVKLLDGVIAFKVSFGGKRFLYAQGPRWSPKWFVANAPPAGAGGEVAEPQLKVQGAALRTDDMQIYVDPMQEWKQMYHEVWRIERDFFYDPNLHGLNWQQAERHYESYLGGLSSRDDLTYLFSDMLGELSVGHLYIEGPQEQSSSQPQTGLLGADYRIEKGRYRFTKIYEGENWNPNLRAPLTAPGVVVHEGDYLLEVNGRELKGNDNIFEFFQGLADQSVVLKVSADSEGNNKRTVKVVPIENETNLRNRAWIEANRRKVQELSGGKLAYVYLPDTGIAGYSAFNRYYFAQIDKQGAILDERFNRGGAAADYIIDYLRRSLMNYWTTREGHDFTTPVGFIAGPKVMITNMYSGSGGDALPWYFRHEQVGKLVGTRTWGELIGVYGYPDLIDGGSVTAPRVAFYTGSGNWEVENVGVPPDVEVDLLPQEWRLGRDPQLEKAVEIALKELNDVRPAVAVRPPFPNYHEEKKAASAGAERNRTMTVRR